MKPYRNKVKMQYSNRNYIDYRVRVCVCLIVYIESKSREIGPMQYYIHWPILFLITDLQQNWSRTLRYFPTFPVLICLAMRPNRQVLVGIAYMVLSSHIYWKQYLTLLYRRLGWCPSTWKEPQTFGCRNAFPIFPKVKLRGVIVDGKHTTNQLIGNLSYELHGCYQK